jgi:hypothetical protein
MTRDKPAIMGNMMKQLNPVMGGWAQDYHSSASYLDHTMVAGVVETSAAIQPWETE